MNSSTTQYINLDCLYVTYTTTETIPTWCWLKLEKRQRRMRNLEKWNDEYKVQVLLTREMLTEKVRMLTKITK